MSPKVHIDHYRGVKQARKPQSYASLKLRPSESPMGPMGPVTGVGCRATRVAKNVMHSAHVYRCDTVNEMGVLTLSH